jgi:hypothetical protein
MLELASTAVNAEPASASVPSPLLLVLLVHASEAVTVTAASPCAVQNSTALSCPAIAHCVHLQMCKATSKEIHLLGMEAHQHPYLVAEVHVQLQRLPYSHRSAHASWLQLAVRRLPSHLPLHRLKRLLRPIAITCTTHGSAVKGCQQVSAGWRLAHDGAKQLGMPGIDIVIQGFRHDRWMEGPASTCGLQGQSQRQGLRRQQRKRRV